MKPDSGEIQLHFLDYWRVIRVRIPLIILVFLLMVITAGVVTYFSPKKYASTVTMQIRQGEQMAVLSMPTGGEGGNQRFIPTQFSIIRQKEILYPVIEGLRLEQKWGFRNKDMAYRKLQDMIRLNEVRNTELISISVLSTDKNEAMEIANAIAEEYRRKRVLDQTQWANKSLSQLEDEVQKQRKRVDDLQAEMVRIARESNVIDLNPNSVEEGMQAESTVLMTVEQQVATERLRVASLRAKYEQLSNMTDEQIMRSIATLEIPDNTIAQTLPLYQESSSEEARLLNSGLGPNHPTVRSLRAKKDVMQTQLRDQISVLRGTLEANLKIAEDSLASLEKRLDEARTYQQQTKEKSSSYYQAKNNYVQNKRVLEAVETRLSTERMQRSMPQEPVTIWEYAEVSDFPAEPRVLLNMALGVMAGLVFGIGLAFFIEYLDTSVKTMEDVENFLQVPVLAVVPRNISNLINESDDNPDAEAYRIMRTNIEFNRKNPDANTVTVVSGGTGEGKSTTLSNIAYTFAKGGYSTLIVDADLRRPSQHRIFGVSNDVGLTDYLTTDMELEEVVMQTKVDNLYFLPSGRLPADAVGILNSQRMVEFIEEVKSRFDIIFFDSPPILGVSDASVLSSAIDLTIIVVQHRRFPRAMLQRVKQAILNVGGNILGVVLNNVDVRHDQHYEYYTSYYNYYYHRPSKDTKAAKAQRKEAGKQAVAASQPRSGRGGEDY
jgi:polysaccharide biosynthesis transport protein